MKKYFILFCVLFSFAGLKSQAQDVIMTRDYSVVNALVSEIGDDYVTYKAFDNQGGPNIKISTKNVFKITFQNGSEQLFRRFRKDGGDKGRGTEQPCGGK